MAFDPVRGAVERPFGAWFYPLILSAKGKEVLNACLGRLQTIGMEQELFEIKRCNMQNIYGVIVPLHCSVSN